MIKKIPPHAKCAYDGAFFQVYQWEEKKPNGEIVLFESVKRPNGTAILPLDSEGNIYYAEQAQHGFGNNPFVGIIGGTIEKGETSLETAKRELIEEAGLASDQWEHFYRWNFPEKIEGYIDYFIARDCRKVEGMLSEYETGEKIILKKCSLENFFKNIAGLPEFRYKGWKSTLYNGLNQEAMNQQIERIRTPNGKDVKFMKY